MLEPLALVALVVGALFVFPALLKYTAQRERSVSPPPEAGGASVGGGGMSMQVGSEGAMQVLTGGSALSFNAPTDDPDPGEPSRDPIDIARRVAEERALRPFDASYVEAAWVLHAAREPVPGLREPLATLLDAARDGDQQVFLDAAREAGNEGWLTVEALGARQWPEALADLAGREGWEPGPVLLDTLAADEPAACAALVATLEDPIARLIGLSTAVLVSPSPRLALPWAELEGELDDDTDDTRGNRALELWQDTEIARLATESPDRALALLDAIRSERTPSPLATRKAIAALARRDPEAARERIGDGEPWDRLPAVLGCHDAGLEMGEAIDEALEELTPHTYRVPEVFSFFLDLAFDSEDPDLLRRVLVQAGPHAWQITSRSVIGVRKLAIAGSDALDACLEACLEGYEPGPVATRDASAGLAAGHVMVRPAWLDFAGVHPLELLVLQTALPEPEPRWS